MVETRRKQVVTENALTSRAAIASKTIAVSSLTGKIHVESDEHAIATPLGQLPFFIGFLKVSGVFDELVEQMPRALRQPQRPR